MPINYINILTAIFRLIFISSSVVNTVASTIFKQMCRTVTEIYKCVKAALNIWQDCLSTYDLLGGLVICVTAVIYSNEMFRFFLFF